MLTAHFPCRVCGQSPAWPLHQELLELLTTQADLQKQVSHLMETEHNLR